jgi:hypothetical protein
MSELLKTVARELTRYTFDFVGIQEVGWEMGQSLNEHWIVLFFPAEKEMKIN